MVSTKGDNSLKEEYGVSATRLWRDAMSIKIMILLTLVMCLSGGIVKPAYVVFCESQHDIRFVAQEAANSGVQPTELKLPLGCQTVRLRQEDVESTMAEVVVVAYGKTPRFAFGFRPHTLPGGEKGYRLVIQYIVRA